MNKTLMKCFLILSLALPAAAPATDCPTFLSGSLTYITDLNTLSGGCVPTGSGGVLAYLPRGAAGGTVDAITTTCAPPVTLTDKAICVVVSAGANTSTTPTFAPNGLTAHTIVSRGGAALVAGDTGAAGYPMQLEYNLANTRWELANPAKVRAASDLVGNGSITGTLAVSGAARIGTAGSPPAQGLFVAGAGTVSTSIQSWNIFAGVNVDLRAGTDAHPDFGTTTNHLLWLMANGARIANVSPSAFNIGNGTSRAALDSVSGAANVNGDGGIAGIFTSPAATANYGTVTINSSDAQSAGLGGTLQLGGLYRAASRDNAAFARIGGFKENSSDGQYGGYLALQTRPNGGNLTEGIRVTSGQQVSLPNGGLARVIATDTGTSRTIAANDTNVIFNNAGVFTVTMPTASSFTGRELYFRTINTGTVISAASNIVPLAGGAAGTAILAGTAGKWAKLVSDGTNWQIMAAN